MARDMRFPSHALQLRHGELFRCKSDSRCGCLAGHRRDFLEFQSGNKHGRRGNSAPAEQLPVSTNEFRLRSKREVEDHLGGAPVELLRQDEERLLRPGLPVGGTPDGHIERFLFDLIRDGEAAEKRARGAGGNIERGAVAVGLQARIARNEI